MKRKERGAILYKEGHAGLSFLIFSPFIFLFRAVGADMNYVVMTCFLMVLLSSIPDLDIKFEMKHRGITHTLLFGFGIGVLCAVVLGWVYGPLGWVMGFVAGFGGTASHLIGDAFTYSPFRPLYPFSNREVAYGFFKASNRMANVSIFVLGLVAFVIFL